MISPGQGGRFPETACAPGRAEIACRVALICALTVWVTSAYGTPEAAISACERAVRERRQMAASLGNAKRSCFCRTVF
ncbi:MAG: hypothetical protein CBARDMAM_4415 [uncultured Caballeronia sp.]|nr:MAG: hypothetical protein CBARDMAM_4415 [uncultured Caballeronia sp.]